MVMDADRSTIVLPCTNCNTFGYFNYDTKLCPKCEDKICTICHKNKIHIDNICLTCHKLCRVCGNSDIVAVFDKNRLCKECVIGRCTCCNTISSMLHDRYYNDVCYRFCGICIPKIDIYEASDDNSNRSVCGKYKYNRKSYLSQDVNSDHIINIYSVLNTSLSAITEKINALEEKMDKLSIDKARPELETTDKKQRICHICEAACANPDHIFCGFCGTEY